LNLNMLLKEHGASVEDVDHEATRGGAVFGRGARGGGKPGPAGDMYGLDCWRRHGGLTRKQERGVGVVFFLIWEVVDRWFDSEEVAWMRSNGVTGHFCSVKCGYGADCI
jgi:hypothetical protein